MNNRQDSSTVANTRLIIQVAEYYGSAVSDIATYKDMNLPTLEALATKHLGHWKQELRELIFNGINCTDQRLAS